jgi:hypothetical protein
LGRRRDRTALRSGLALVAASTGLLVTAALAQAGGTTFNVTNLNDSGSGSLRRAITDANSTLGGGDTIVFNSGLSGTIQLASALPAINEGVSIQGPGADEVTVRRNIGGNYGIFVVNSGVGATISGLAITNGSSSTAGGGIRSDGSLSVNQVAITGNSADIGGGIGAFGTLTVSNSLVSDNTASGTDSGGGIDAEGTTTIRSSTITGNTDSEAGAAGGILSFSASTLTLEDSTVASNTGPSSGGAGNLERNTGTFNVKSTVVSTPLGGSPNCDGTITSQGFNLESANSCGFAQATDQHDSDPLLGPLQDNGGPTKTMAPAGGSPVINAGSAFGLTTDQRGAPRPFQFPGIQNAAGGDGSDIGAYELALPDTKLTKARIRSARHRATFKFKANGLATGFQCKLKRKHRSGRFKSCRSPKTYKRLGPGKYTFEVRAVGPDGPDRSPAKKRFKIT